ncbi:MAG: helix-turn-helix transcriptional regulator [Oscillospiraceae bacterium]|nr:helix-turn-helix transcriptional regulator [Oscillospiraceae bacterium]
MYEKYSEIRSRKGLNDQKVSQITGIPRSMFSDWKHGRSKPKTEKLVKIAKILECSVMELIGEE